MQGVLILGEPEGRTDEIGDLKPARCRKTLAWMRDPAPVSHSDELPSLQANQIRRISRLGGNQR